MKSLRVAAILMVCLATGLAAPWRLLAQAPAVQPAKDVKYSAISPTDMKEWLSYLSSDELEGRQIFTEGYGLAAEYVADHLKAWHLKPLGQDGTYFEPVKYRGYKVTRNSSVTVEVNGASRTFKHGDHVTFVANSGGKQSLTFNGVYFAGYAAEADLNAASVKDQLVISVPNSAPAAGGPAGRGGGRGAGRGGGAFAISTLGARAAIAYVAAAPAPTPAEQALAEARAALTQATTAVTQAEQALQGPRAGGPAGGGRGAAAAGGGGRGAATTQADITTVVNVESLIPPQITADDTFYEFLFSAASTKFADIKAKAAKGEALPPMSLTNVKVTINIDNAFEVVSQQLSKNVVGMVEGTDPTLKNTYVLFGAHLDHIGYSQTGRSTGPSPSGCRQRGPAALDALTKAGTTPQSGGRRGGGAGTAATPAPAPVPFESRDLINNGADDDGSGSTAELAIAKAFATGPKPRRSVVFIWHTGEEAGLYGSRYNADFPVVPLDRVQAQLNMDMVGRDDCNDLEGDYSNSVFIIGADRISTDLHNVIVETNATLPKPLALDYEMNDPNDPESVYTRSDHYSYASKGIPIAFFTTGLHPDYHRVSDTVDKILFPKMARIAQLVYETGFSIANTDRILERDNKGPRTGFGSKAEVIKK